MDTIRIPRESLDTFLKVSREVLNNTISQGDEGLERTEVMLNVLHRKKLKEAVFEGEKAIYRKDVGPLPAEKMSTNAQRIHEFEDFSENKMNWIEGKR